MATPSDRRVRWNRYATRMRERKQEKANCGQRFCQFRQGKHGLCAGLLEFTILPGGRVVATCPKCERRKRGICQECPARVEGRVGNALRCRECKHRERAHAADRYRTRHPNYLVKQTARRLRDARERTPRYLRRLEVKKAWRERNKVRTKLQKRKWRLNPNRPNGYSSREKYEAYHAAYRAKHRERKRELARLQYYREHPDRPHPICACGCERAIPWDGSGRPAKWLREHCPHPRSLTPEETIMKAAERAIAMLERAAESVRKKLAGKKQLEEELEGIQGAIAQLRAIVPASTGESAPIRGRRKRAA